MEIQISNYGGTITKIITPDKNNLQNDIVLGYDKLKFLEEDQ